MNMNLDYISAIFSNPLDKYKRLLSQISVKMQADYDDDSDNGGLIMDNMESMGDSAASIAKSGAAIVARYAHFKTEIAFYHVKEHELVESSCQKGRLALGSANIELDLRVQLMQSACNQLR